MLTESKLIGEYRTPNFRVLKLQVNNMLCTSPTSEDFNGQQNIGGNWDDDE